MQLKEQIIHHYDELSPYYLDIWGMHIHNGYWKTGTELKEEAQEQLITELVSRANIAKNSRILDVGCGLGGTAVYLSKNLGANVTGITISPTQVEIGKNLAKHCSADVRLLLMDAEALEMEDRFDVVWSVEAISHLSDKPTCFRSIAHALDSGGTLVIADWFRSSTATPASNGQCWCRSSKCQVSLRRLHNSGGPCRSMLRGSERKCLQNLGFGNRPDRHTGAVEVRRRAWKGLRRLSGRICRDEGRLQIKVAGLRDADRA